MVKVPLILTDDAPVSRKYDPGALAQIQLADEVKRVEKERKHVQQRLRRLWQGYYDGLVADAEYRRQKLLLEERQRSLVVTDADAAMTAVKLLENLPSLWKKADLAERRCILLAMLDAVYVDTVEEKSIVAIRPKAAFRPLFEIATTREGSGIVLISELPPDEDGHPAETTPAPPLGGQGADALPCFWWRRGRVWCSQFANDVVSSLAWRVVGPRRAN